MRNPRVSLVDMAESGDYWQNIVPAKHPLPDQMSESWHIPAPKHSIYLHRCDVDFFPFCLLVNR